jgi:VanZ family protein
MKLVPIAFAFFLGLVAVVFAADMGWLRPQEVFAFKDGDKVLHFLLLGMLTLLVDLALVQAMPRSNARMLTLLGSAVIAALSSVEEFSQLWVPVRSPDWLDLVASYAGILVATLMALVLSDLVRAPKRSAGNTA